MDMPDVIYVRKVADKTLSAIRPESPIVCECHTGKLARTKYHHSRIVEALRQQVKTLAKAFDEDATAAECCKAAKLA